MGLEFSCSPGVIRGLLHVSAYFLKCDPQATMQLKHKPPSLVSECRDSPGLTCILKTSMITCCQSIICLPVTHFQSDLIFNCFKDKIIRIGLKTIITENLLVTQKIRLHPGNPPHATIFLPAWILHSRPLRHSSPVECHLSVAAKPG